MSHDRSSGYTSPDRPGPTSETGTPGIVAEQAQDTARQVVDQAQQAAGQVTEQAKQHATSQLESQRERTVDTLTTVAQALRKTGDHLREQEQSSVGGYVARAADTVESISNHLRTRDVPALLAETQDFARRKPGLFLSSAVALGFIGARFLKSSGQRAVAHGSAGSGPLQSYGYSEVRPLHQPAPYAGASPSRTPGAATYDSTEAPEPMGSDRARGSAGALDT